MASSAVNSAVSNPSQNGAYSAGSDCHSLSSGPQTKITVISDTATRTTTSTTSSFVTIRSSSKNLQTTSTPRSTAQSTQTTGDAVVQTASGRLPKRENKESSDEGLPDGGDEGDKDEGDEEDDEEEDENEDEDDDDDDDDENSGDDEDEDDEDDEDEDNEDDEDEDDEEECRSSPGGGEYDTELYGSDEEMDHGELEDWTEVDYPNDGPGIWLGNQTYEVLTPEARDQYRRNLTASVDWLIATING